MEERINILKADIEEQLKIIDRIYAKIQKRKTHFKESEENLESMALQIHNFYCAVEELFKIIADFFENRIEEKEYHKNLLRRMKEEIEGVRPSVISESTFRLLDELRRFRHLIRHAYDIEIDPERLEIILNFTEKAYPELKKDIEEFMGKLG